MADSEAVEAILARGEITADDVIKLRYRVFWKGVFTPDDAEMVFVLNDRWKRTPIRRGRRSSSRH